MKHDDDIPSHLRQVSADDLPLRRQKWGRGYRYLGKGGNAIEHEKQLAFLKSIPVPDTWTEVKLSDDPQAHILAVGFDGSGNLQYLYHPDFMEHSNKRKFEHLQEFGMSLPRIRRRLWKDLRQPEWSEQKLLALIVRILDRYHLRIGSRVYARQNESFGLTTLRKKHLKEVESALRFEYIGKSGKHRQVKLNDPQLVGLIEELADFSGWELFSFQNQGTQISATGSKVNEYIRNISGKDFSARNFRTWAGTVLAVKYRHRAMGIHKQNPRRKLKAIIVEMVAEKLGNTRSICEQYYIHPKILEKVQSEEFNAEPCDERFLKNTLYRKHECRTLELLAESAES